MFLRGKRHKRCHFRVEYLKHTLFTYTSVHLTEEYNFDRRIFRSARQNTNRTRQTVVERYRNIILISNPFKFIKKSFSTNSPLIDIIDKYIIIPDYGIARVVKIDIWDALDAVSHNK